MVADCRYMGALTGVASAQCAAKTVSQTNESHCVAGGGVSNTVFGLNSILNYCLISRLH